MKTPQILEYKDWIDLVAYKPWEVMKEISLPVPWLALEIWASSQQIYWLTLLAGAYFFLTCLRVSHNAFHYCLGLSRPMTDMVMLLLSVFMMTSMRATQYTHMQHHRHCLAEGDVEGHIARMGFAEMLVHAPLFTVKLHIEALKHSKKKTWVWFELLLNITWILAVWLWWEFDALKIHVVLMLSSHAISPLFTVWSVHHDSELSAAKNEYNSRTLRSRWMSFLAYNMFFHLEHHEYPAIPTCHLPELAERLDRSGLMHYKTVF